MDYQTFQGGAVGRTLVETVAAPSLGLRSAPGASTSKLEGRAAGRPMAPARRPPVGPPSRAERPSKDRTRASVAPRHWLRQRVGKKLERKAGLIETPGRRLTAGVGPSGVGETTTLAGQARSPRRGCSTKDHCPSVARSAAGAVNLRREVLAKLAARAVVSFERSVRVVSLDIFRVGAVEQWRRPAELVGFTGRGVREPHFASDASPEITGASITKLDETDQVGDAAHALIDRKLPVTYPRDGARVPEDTHDAAADKVLDAFFPEQA